MYTFTRWVVSKLSWNRDNQYRSIHNFRALIIHIIITVLYDIIDYCCKKTTRQRILVRFSHHGLFFKINYSKITDMTRHNKTSVLHTVPRSVSKYTGEVIIWYRKTRNPDGTKLWELQNWCPTNFPGYLEKIDYDH